MSAHNLDLHAIDQPIVRSAIEAMNSRNKKQWYGLFCDKAKLTDDGNPYDFSEWSERELFGSSIAYLASIDKVENGGLTIYGKFHSDQWGDFKTFMRSNVENNKITKLEVGQTDE